MKIKLPFTEKFLWELYNLSEKASDLLDSCMSEKWYGLKGIEEIIWPDIYVARDLWEDKYKKKKYLREKSRKNFAKLLYKLKQGGYIKILRVKDRSAVLITPKGLEKVFTIKIKSVDKKIRPDKKWQMVLFDIPEKKKRERDLFRKSLKYLGYKNLQKSIWVCPYDVLNETKALIRRYKLEPHVELLLVKKIGLG